MFSVCQAKIGRCIDRALLYIYSSGFYFLPFMYSLRVLQIETTTELQRWIRSLTSHGEFTSKQHHDSDRFLLKYHLSTSSPLWSVCSAAQTAASCIRYLLNLTKVKEKADQELTVQKATWTSHTNTNIYTSFPNPKYSLESRQKVRVSFSGLKVMRQYKQVSLMACMCVHVCGLNI